MIKIDPHKQYVRIFDGDLVVPVELLETLVNQAFLVDNGYSYESGYRNPSAITKCVVISGQDLILAQSEDELSK